MKLLIPFSRKTDIDYYLHRQYNRFVHVLGVGIQRIAQEHAQTIAQANLKAGKEISHSLDKGFHSIQQSQAAIETALIDQNHILQSGFNELEITLSDGFDKTAKGLNEVANRVDNVGKLLIESHEQLYKGLAGIKAAVDMGMMSLVSQFELQREEIQQGFHLLTNLLENAKKTEARERYLDGVQAFETYLKHPDEPQFLTDARDYLLQSIEAFRGNPFAHLYLGHMYEEASLYFDLSKAKDHYLRCATYAKGLENKGLASVGYFMASWVAYVEGGIDDAIAWGKAALEMDADRIPEVYYNLAKFHAYRGEAETSLDYLDYAIQHFDPIYSLKAQFDPDFGGMREELTTYFHRIRDRKAQELDKRLTAFGITEKGLE